jgi:hypothetical protein
MFKKKFSLVRLLVTGVVVAVALFMVFKASISGNIV